LDDVANERAKGRKMIKKTEKIAESVGRKDASSTNRRGWDLAFGCLGHDCTQVLLPSFIIASLPSRWNDSTQGASDYVPLGWSFLPKVEQWVAGSRSEGTAMRGEARK
jgi:hypothetical protein